MFERRWTDTWKKYKVVRFVRCQYVTLYTDESVRDQGIIIHNPLFIIGAVRAASFFVAMHENRVSFQELAKGKFGRKTAYVDYERIDDGNVLDALSKTIGVLNYNRPLIRYLWQYKNGDQPILYREKTIRDDIVNKVVENHAWEIVQFKNSQTYGEPVQYISVKKNDEVNNKVDELNDYAKAAGKPMRDIESGAWTSAVGTGYKAIQFKDGDVPFRIIAPSPMNTYIIYSRITEEPLMSVQEFRDEDGYQYYQCFTDSIEYRIQNGKVIYRNVHAFGSVPIVEYPNNMDRVSDIELVCSMLDAINNMQSNRMDSIEQFVQSWVKFVNCDVDEEKFKKMKMLGALVVTSNNGDTTKADVDIMSQELNQQQSQIAKEDLLDNVFSILSIPNKEEQNSGGDTAGAVSLRAGWDHAKQTARLKDAYVEHGDKKLAMLMLNRLRIVNGDTKNAIGVMDFDCQVNHSLQDNMYIKAEVLKMLLDAGVHPLVASETCGLWSDSEKVYTMSKPYYDGKYKTADELREEQMLQLEQKTSSNTESTRKVKTNVDQNPRTIKRGLTKE